LATALTAYRPLIQQLMQTRNAVSRAFFAREAERLARVCGQMADRFLRGGRLLAFGTGAAASDAQHIAVEFVHPVLVGKRALPALDLSSAYRDWVPAVVRSEDVVIGFGPPAGDTGIDLVIRGAMSRGALSVALPGTTGDYAIAAPCADPFIHQEIIEILYHTLWETVHVFLERQPLGHDAGTAGFLYPFLADDQEAGERVVLEVAASIRSKAACVERLRDQVAAEQGEAIAAATIAIHERIARGGTIVIFGNGGSATDATDLALDLVAPPKGQAPVPAITLAADPATLTAIANDIGSDAMFLRQIIAHGRPQDVAVAISTSGGSANIMAALSEARTRGLLTVAFLGYDGGEVLRRGLADHALVVRSDQIPRVQEVQASIYHVMLDLLDVVRCDQGAGKLWR
jgi:D-sedoheptulose 7-phosphate isomerase